LGSGSHTPTRVNERHELCHVHIMVKVRTQQCTVEQVNNHGYTQGIDWTSLRPTRSRRTFPA